MKREDEIFSLIEKEHQRQLKGIELIGVKTVKDAIDYIK